MTFLGCVEPDDNLKIGKIIEVDGSHLKIELDSSIDELTRVYSTEVYSIGQFGSILKTYFGNKLLFMYVTRLRLKSELEAEKGNYIPPSEDTRILEADLFGEGEWKFRDSDNYDLIFERGISIYPLPLQTVYLTTSLELRYIYETTNLSSIKIGTYVGTGLVPCYANIDELFCKHTAILGSTGSGKSSAVSVIIHSILDYEPVEGNTWHPFILILDPHNEYEAAFPNAQRLVPEEGSLVLPYWLLSFQELLDLIIGKTEYQATSQTNILKTALIKARGEGAENIGLKSEEISIDSPVPFSLTRLIELIKEDMPSQLSRQDKHQSILNKIEVLKEDVRLNFMMQNWESSDGDKISDIIDQFINRNHPLRIIDLSGIPSDVAGIISSTIARLIFMYKLWEDPVQRKKDPILFVCEEAHRYVPNRGEAEYSSAQDAIRRIAKEGRKYGIGLLLISQRPSEIEQTVLSQCNTWLVFRLTNEEDQSRVMRFLPDSLSGLGKILSALRRREAIFIGQAAPMPARIFIDHLNNQQLPYSKDISFVKGWQSNILPSDEIESIVNRWRTQIRANYDVLLQNEINSSD